ncbi:glycosyltransferase [Candidatus Peribacteria bacterium]|nr:glycosyltransferase [Candidatus Peribacteria bacterium]MBT4241185.1 glycosyltransferase [Candidatus Peribacteria bacterium]MBT4473938.1 glycosyltransferase [Candidatus Peribacteria bacterium]
MAITTDWLVTLGGAERVISEMIKLWPEADIFTVVYDESETKGLSEKELKIHTSSLQKYYSIIKKHRLLLPLMPKAVESWDLSKYDTIISSSHAVAKGLIPPSSAKHICYCHTPMRYAWEMEEKYLDDFGLFGPFRSFAKWNLKKLRHWDRTTAKRVDQFIANSSTTQKRIERAYGRDSIVLPPPVNDKFFEINHTEPKENYFLALGRLVPYKRVDLLIEAANRKGFRLKIAGSGPEEAHLKKIAGPTVEFLGYIPEEGLSDLYSKARAFLFPVEEDAGIVPLESQACGTPVIAYGKGGVLDTVINRETGIFFTDHTSESLINAMDEFENSNFDSNLIKEHAKKFSGERFRKKLKNIVENMSC